MKYSPKTYPLSPVFFNIIKEVLKLIKTDHRKISDIEISKEGIEFKWSLFANTSLLDQKTQDNN